ncbi:MAG TPA: molecular chaperone DnaJ, partial [Candidatus Ventricola gallistercoris]|nr:molecular chaperone DnaJ [Candidatus Ventricola gallistercoris]
LCKRYHPDANVGKPDAAQAEKKFMEVQQAYEEIMHRRQGGGQRAGSGYNGPQQQRPPQGGYDDPFSTFWGTGGYGQHGGYGQYGGYQQAQQESTIEMRAAKNYIDTGHYAEALNALGSVPPGKRNARWYFLSALAQNGLHNNAQAMEYAQQAVAMEPSNMQYQQLLSQLQSGGTWYNRQGQQYGRQSMERPNLCCSIMALELCCMCCGGGRMMYYPLFCCF